jgi:hypothetical protein
MANDNDPDIPDWIDQSVQRLEGPAAFDADAAAGRARLREREGAATQRRRRGRRAAVFAAVAIVVVALPWPRAFAQRLWDRFTLRRVEVVQITGRELPESITAMFTMEDRRYSDPIEVTSAAEAVRMAGFAPALPPLALIGEVPRLSVVKWAAMKTAPVDVPAIQAALARAGITDLTIPQEWQGVTLTAEGGPMIIANYERLGGFEITQMPALRMNVPERFPFEQFMSIGFRLFGRGRDDARTLAREIAANPALLMHFPEHDRLREVTLDSGRGLIVGDDEGGCFFWGTGDRIFLVGTGRMTDEQAVTLANSVRQGT